MSDQPLPWHSERELTEGMVNVLLAELLTFHSVREIPWRGERIKGVVDFLAVGDNWVFTCSHVVTVADGVAGSADNEACVVGSDG